MSYLIRNGCGGPCHGCSLAEVSTIDPAGTESPTWCGFLSPFPTFCTMADGNHFSDSRGMVTTICHAGVTCDEREKWAGFLGPPFFFGDDFLGIATGLAYTGLWRRLNGGLCCFQCG